MSDTFEHAIVRLPGENAEAGLTTANLGRPIPRRLFEQHSAYVSVLRKLGLNVIQLDQQPGFPDAYFVEDTAVVIPQVAIVARPGAAQRRGEEESISAVLAPFRPVVCIEEPGTLDGGDVLAVDSDYFVGLSTRTNEEGARQLGRILQRYGYTCTPVPVAGGLHLKSSINYVGNRSLLVTEAFADLPALGDYVKITVPADEDYAVNSLLVNDCLLTPAGFPQTRERLEALGQEVIELETSEIRKMDGGLTCLSLRF